MQTRNLEKWANCQRLRVHLHYGDNPSKLVCFKELKYFFNNKNLAWSDFRHSVNTTLVTYWSTSDSYKSAENIIKVSIKAHLYVRLQVPISD